MKQVQTNATGAVVYGTELTYNALNNLTQLEEIIGGETRTTSYTYDEDNRIDEYTVGEIRGKYNYDSFGRLSSQQTKYGDTVIKTDTFIFEDLRANEYTSAQVSKHGVSASGYNKILDYDYDSNGNITKISRVDDLAGNAQTVLAEYTYDTQNQLLSEVFPTQRKTVWTYDNAGNIQTRTEYTWEDGDWCVADTVSYGYVKPGDTPDPWGDLLWSYDGRPFTYDAIGNPLTDGTWTYTWEHGRQLASMAKTGESWEYTYNAAGIRTKRVRTVGETETTWEYIYSGSQLVRMITGTDTLTFTYGANGTPTALTHNGTVYYYVTNLQGDIVAILDDEGALAAEYTYDAWGNPISQATSGIGALNPLRYRGYVWDAETQLYYLQSRYYDPEIGRFINADGLLATGQGVLGNNMFAYCGNNPVNCKDPTGQFGIGALIFAAVVATCAIILSGCSSNSGPYGGSANCYAYALNQEVDPITKEPFDKKPQPGSFSGNPLADDDIKKAHTTGGKDAVEEVIMSKVEADCAALGYCIREVDSPDFISYGGWVIALAYQSSGGYDYHFFKKQNTTIWTHKPGTNEVMQWDFSHGTITDPANCNRGKYDTFVGYYEIVPNIFS